MRPVKLKTPYQDYQQLHHKAFNSRAENVPVNRKALVKLFQDHQELLRHVEHENPEARGNA